MFKGSCVAMVTPFRDGNVDYGTVQKLVRWHIDQGTDCIVPCGCTGEAATLNKEEHHKVIKTVIKEAAGKIKIMAGTGSNATWAAIELTQFAKKAGADGALIISPYYNKPTQEGIYRHYRKIAETVDIPICLYNVPGRTGSNIEAETVRRLSEISNIVAVKEASGSIDQCAKIIRLCGENITLLSGDDSLTYPLMALGATGVVSVLANVVPDVVSELTGSFLSGDISRSKELHYSWFPLMNAMFIETNPVPVKEAMAMIGKIRPELRLPLVNLESENRETLRQVMKESGLEVS
ncbi:4-hydroxy-tetrahydrodipicolinate synthase [Elusimicrobiota bacterium]